MPLRSSGREKVENRRNENRANAISISRDMDETPSARARMLKLKACSPAPRLTRTGGGADIACDPHSSWGERAVC